MSGEESKLPVRFEKGEVAYLMRRQGMSNAEIADELHITPTQVSSYIKSRLSHEAQRLTDEDREFILALENERLDYYLSKLWPQIEYGDINAIRTALQITKERTSLNQMDRPSSTNTTQVLVVGGQTQDYVERLKELAEGA